MDIYNAIAEPTRRTIIEMLAKKGRLSVADIGVRFSMSAPAISQHLKVLREAHLVRVEKQGKRRIYELDMDALYEIERWTHKMTSLWNGRLDRLGVLLQDKKIK
jgi:DNA-binding transcriptional ArsR family regulator